MLRFPLHQKLILVTTAGVIKGEIVRATDDFVFCQNVEYQDQKLGKLYIDRNSIVGFSDIYEKKTENLKLAIHKTTRILNFRDYNQQEKQG